MTMAEGELAITKLHFVRDQHLSPQAPPVRMTGPIGWIRANLLSTPVNVVLTVLVLLLTFWVIRELLDFLIINSAPRSAPAGRSSGRGSPISPMAPIRSRSGGASMCSSPCSR